jgi:23S rRNA (adenine2503-C2)-methyltransferase
VSTTDSDSSASLNAGEREDLLGLDRSGLEARLAPVVDRRFRVEQVFRALHQQHVADLREITTLSKELREELARRFRVGLPEVVSQRASEDGTVKFLLGLEDSATIEAVDIPEGPRRTLCISSQAGCALGCTFCVTGYWGGGRDLTAGEIVGQVRVVQRSWETPPERLNLVFMGMGEPLLNLEALHTSLEILTETLSWRRITVSTAGVVPGIEAMARWPRRPNLAISLHGASDELRERIMPINRRYPLAELMGALHRFPLERGEKLTFEYILIRDLNDGPDQADALARLLHGLRAKVNLIPINPDPVLGSTMIPPSPERVQAFQTRLRQRGLLTTLRRRRGDDVSAACGQLRAFGREPRGAPSRRPTKV